MKRTKYGKLYGIGVGPGDPEASDSESKGDPRSGRCHLLPEGG